MTITSYYEEANVALSIPAKLSRVVRRFHELEEAR